MRTLRAVRLAPQCGHPGWPYAWTVRCLGDSEPGIAVPNHQPDEDDAEPNREAGHPSDIEGIPEGRRGFSFSNDQQPEEHVGVEPREQAKQARRDDQGQAVSRPQRLLEESPDGIVERTRRIRTSKGRKASSSNPARAIVGGISGLRFGGGRPSCQRDGFQGTKGSRSRQRTELGSGAWRSSTDAKQSNRHADLASWWPPTLIVREEPSLFNRRESTRVKAQPSQAPGDPFCRVRMSSTLRSGYAL